MYTNLYLIHKVPPIIGSRRPFQLLLLFQKYKKGMIFHENRLPADDSHEISHLIFLKIGKDVEICRLLQLRFAF